MPLTKLSAASSGPIYLKAVRWAHVTRNSKQVFLQCCGTTSVFAWARNSHCFLLPHVTKLTHRRTVPTVSIISGFHIQIWQNQNWPLSQVFPKHLNCSCVIMHLNLNWIIGTPCCLFPIRQEPFCDPIAKGVLYENKDLQGSSTFSSTAWKSWLKTPHTSWQNASTSLRLI